MDSELSLSLLEALDSSLGVSLEVELEGVLDVFVDVVLLEVVAVEALDASASAEVFVGGVIPGVLFGTASETLLEPPHAASDSASAAIVTSAVPARSGPCAASLTRRGVPCDGRTWDSR